MTKSARTSPPPRGVVELLRLFVVIFFGLGGYQLGSVLQVDGDEVIVGPFNGVILGTLLGLSVGYVLGGVLGRTTVTVVDRTEHALRSVSAEALVTGGLGAIFGGVLGAVLAWPLFLLPSLALSLPLFGFVVVSLGLAGFRLGAQKRDGVLAVLGGRGGLPRREPAASTVPRIVDTSVAIDGRLLDVVRAGFLHGRMVVPAPVLDELQAFADAADPIKRAKGRRGLDMLQALRREPGVDVEVLDDAVPAVPEVDAKLVRLCLDRQMALLTLDTNLAKVAALAGVRVLNLHSLTLALRPPVLAGDDVTVLITKPGREPGQGVGYLDDGTMVVAEGCRKHVGYDVTLRVTSVLTTANGRMVFAHRLDDDATPAPTPRATPEVMRPRSRAPQISEADTVRAAPEGRA